MNMRDHMLSALSEQLNGWEDLLVGISPAQISSPLLPSSWSVKDVLAHLMAWQQRSIARLEAAREDREPVFPRWGSETEPEGGGNTQLANEWIYQAYRGFPWLQVHQDWRAGYLRLLALCEEFPEIVLLDGDRYPWMNGYSLADVLLGTYEHHLEHYQKLVAWLRVHGGQPGSG
jgi:hypothetical protein